MDETGAPSPIATPLPLGFLGLAFATTAFSAVQLEWVPAGQGHDAALTALLITVPVQLLACVMGLAAGDPVAGTGMGVLAGTWAVVSTVTLTSGPGSTSRSLGVTLVSAAVAILVPALSGWGRPAAAAVMTLAALRFAVTGVYELTGSDAWKTAAGVTGLVLMVAAVYAALGFALEAAYRRPVLPLLHRP